MQPLSRLVPKLFYEPIASSTAKTSLRIPHHPSLRPSICLQCRLRTQRRPFADSSKPNPPNPASSKASHTPSPSPEPLSTPIQDEIATDLPSTEEGRRLAVTKRFSQLMDHLQGNIFIASQRINDLTGYSGIEALKSRITILEKRAQDAQEAVRSSRIAYKTTVAERAATQREVTTLLARKDTWTPTDLERFTELYRMDHSNEQAVQDVATKLADAEREAEHAASKLSSSILSRYHEEQIWSDKIRRMSTWGTWGLMGVNVLLFLVFQFGFEPWRRRRLVHGFEEKVREALQNEKMAAQARQQGGSKNVGEVSLDGVVASGIQELEEEMDAGVGNPTPAVEAVVTCIREEDPEVNASMDAAELHVPSALMRFNQRSSWTTAVQDLFSDRVMQVSKKDLSVIALEGAATGAAVVAIIAILLRPS